LSPTLPEPTARIRLCDREVMIAGAA